MTDEEMAAEIAQMRTEDDAYEDRWPEIWFADWRQAREDGHP